MRNNKVKQTNKTLPKEQSAEIAEEIYNIPTDGAIVHQYQAVEFKGPLPHPEILKGYDIIVPGAAERILAMAEKEQAHRIESDKYIIEEQMTQFKRGQMMGFILCLILIVVAIVFAFLGHVVLATIILSGTIVSLAVIFVLRQKPDTKSQS